MKKLFILPLLCAFCYVAVSKSAAHQPTIIAPAQKDSLSAYVGRYQSIQKAGTFSIETAITEDKRIVATSLWDGNKYVFKHLDGDNFFLPGFDWTVKFIRDKDGKITQMLVKGTEYWDKVK